MTINYVERALERYIKERKLQKLDAALLGRFVTYLKVAHVPHRKPKYQFDDSGVLNV